MVAWFVTIVVIAYVAARALCQALGVELTKQPTFDAASGTFNFPM